MTLLPNDINLPLFVYGALQVDEISWPIISRYVSVHTKAYLDGYQLALADGAAFAIPQSGRTIEGFLLSLSDPKTAYLKLAEFERVPNIYVWKQTEINGSPANFLAPASDLRTRYDLVDSWTSALDPWFGYQIPLTAKSISRLSGVIQSHSGFASREYIEAFLELQSTYSSLWTLTERIYSFRVGPRKKDVNGKELSLKDALAALANNPEWNSAVLSARINSQLRINSNSRPFQDRPSRPGNFGFTGWYEMRNNIVHRGKGSQKEVQSLLIACTDLHNSLAFLLQEISPPIRELWQYLTQLDDLPYSDELYIIHLPKR